MMPLMDFNSASLVLLSVQLLLLLQLLPCTHCAIESAHDPTRTHRQVGIQYSRDFGVSSFVFSGEWAGRPYQATIHTRAICHNNKKHMRMIITIAPAPHPYYKWGRLYEFSVTPTEWFTPEEDGMPKIWFQEYKTGAKVTVKQHVEEREVDGTWFFEDPWVPVCWLGTTNLELDTAYTLNIEGSERSYQAVPPGPCPSVHWMFQGQLPVTGNTSAPATGSNTASQDNDGRQGRRRQNAADMTKPMVWMAPVQKVVFAKSHMAYMLHQHLEYHVRLGFAGTLLTCDYFVCLELLQEPALARSVEEGRLVLWMWEHGNEYAKPHQKLYVANNLLRLAGYGTPALFTFQDLDEFMVIPSGQPIHQLLGPGGCLAGVRKYAQAAIQSKVALTTNWTNADPNLVGEFPAWLTHDLWVDAVDKMNYSMAPQAFCGWKSLVDPNFNYSFLCHDHFDRMGMMSGGHWANYVDDSCAYNMHFTNWFSNRFASHTVGGVVGDFLPLSQLQLATLRAVYQSGADNSNSSSAEKSHPAQHVLKAERLAGQFLNTTSNLQHGADGSLDPQCPMCHIKHTVKTVSVTLVTRNSEILIGDALRSVVAWVDACLLVYASTVESPWLTLAAAAEAVGDKLVAFEIPSAGFGEMLNSSMSLAKQTGAEWAMFIGPDEQVVADNGTDMWQAVESAITSGMPQYNCYHKSLDYSQAFLVQLSAGGGFVHNQYVQSPGRPESTLQGCTVMRPEKTIAWAQRRAREAIQAVRQGNTSTDMPQAAWFVLAEANWVLGEHQHAQAAWQQCSEMLHSTKLGALCAYRLAVLVHIPASAHAEALKALQKPINMHGCSPELCWLASFTAYHAGKYEESKELALQAVDVGCYQGSCIPEGRILMNVGTRYGFPFDVMSYALLQLGDAVGAESAQKERQLANLASQENHTDKMGVTAAIAVV